MAKGLRRFRYTRKKGRGKALLLLAAALFTGGTALSEWGLGSISEELTQEAARAYVLAQVNQAVEEALAQIPLVNDTEDTRELYSVIDQRVQEDVPMFSAYVISSLGAVNKRLTGVTPTVYGFFNHVEQWDVAE